MSMHTKSKEVEEESGEKSSADEITNKTDTKSKKSAQNAPLKNGIPGCLRVTRTKLPRNRSIVPAFMLMNPTSRRQPKQEKEEQNTSDQKEGNVFCNFGYLALHYRQVFLLLLKDICIIKYAIKFLTR